MSRPRREPEAPSVTVMLASHDRLEFLQDAVRSALQQEYPNFEVLVVDDGSGPTTREWLERESSSHANLRVIFAEHEGVGAARMRGVLEAKGELICVLDSDDLLTPNTLSLVVDELTRDGGADLVYVNNVHLLPSGERVTRSYPEFRSSRSMLWATLLSARVPFKHTGTTYRRDAALALGSYDPGLPCKIDVDFFLKFLAHDRRLRLVHEPVAIFRFHRQSISRDRRAGIGAWFVLIDRYAPAIPGLRWPLKLLRAGQESAKWLYERVAIRRRPQGA